jgi:hypothetical protein
VPVEAILTFNKLKELLKTLDTEQVLKKLHAKAKHDKWSNIDVSDDLKWIRRKAKAN